MYIVSNAIQVKNIAGMQVGHIPRAIASKLAPLLDQHRVTVEGVIRDGNREPFVLKSMSCSHTAVKYS